MSSYIYKGRILNGEVVSGEIEAANLDAASSLLRQRQIFVTSLVPKQDASQSILLPIYDYFAKRKKVKSEEIILLTRQLYSLTKAGVPIISSINGLAETNNNPLLVVALRNMGESLIGGSDLATSFARQHKIFSPEYVSMVRVGESTGRLDSALAKLVKHLEFNREIKKRIKAAVRYPVMVIAAIVIAVAVITLFVIPQFSSVFNKLGAELPLPTIILMRSSEFMQQFWWLLLLIAIAVFFALKHYIRTDKGAYQWDKMLLKIPLLGEIFQRIALARFSRSFSMMLSAGVPVVQALGVTAETIGNNFVAAHVRSMQNGIEMGDRIVNTAHATGMFTPLVLQMIAIGEETGSVDELLTEVADFYEEEIDFQLKMLSDAIEPILLVFLGAMVLVLALGVFLPIWDLSKAALPG